MQNCKIYQNILVRTVSEGLGKINRYFSIWYFWKTSRPPARPHQFCWHCFPAIFWHKLCNKSMKLVVLFFFTFFGFIITVFTIVAVVVKDVLVVVVFTPVFWFITNFMVFIAIQSLIFQSKRVSRNELSLTSHATEALKMKYFFVCPHDVVIFAESAAAFITFCAKKSDIVLLAVGFSIADKAGAVFIKKHLAFVALKITVFLKDKRGLFMNHVSQI